MAIMQQKDVTASDAACQASQDALRIAFAGVEAAPGPTHELQADAMQHGSEESVAQARWRTKVARSYTRDIDQDVLRHPQFPRQAARAQQ